MDELAGLRNIKQAWFVLKYTALSIHFGRAAGWITFRARRIRSDI